MSQIARPRTVGVEEELLLVDASTGDASSVASEVLRVAKARGITGEESAEPSGGLGPELQEQQVETDTAPEEDLGRIEADLRLWRERARLAAAETGSLVLASGTSPLPVEPQPAQGSRYEQMADRFGLTVAEQLSCGCHVHVAIESEEEAIAVVDRIRSWLPVLLALSANSPFWQGQDSRYASYRSQLIGRWPTSGPTAVYGSVEGHRRHLDQLLATGVLLDEGMVYNDVRLAQQYPTVEIRIADVCLDVHDTILIAALSRGLVETAAREWRAGTASPDAPISLLRLSSWQAGRFGLSGDLLDPVEHRPRPASEVVSTLVDYVSEALDAAGDTARVEKGLAELRDRGTGADWQRARVAETGDLAATVLEMARLTAPEPGTEQG
ncbi:carboxylate-amine ligase [Nocardioides massiliensis]|uniref:Putative glutamate--cysteine ligase 2 n=1 Tax=Nocardioides massiliensis TaxID=1325935 RepID=A0ABT9NVE9_9ACTN|nr:glutamate--cysteine ligase [Nocardioides massiliensis]MDP9823980.1 carboxylate-amine ligase [Nocardioides massiliensis]